jgi:hypothetical protein
MLTDGRKKMLRKFFSDGMSEDSSPVEGMHFNQKNLSCLLIKVAHLFLGLILVIGSGCAHKMDVKNLHEFSVVPTSGKRMDVALATCKGSGDEMIYFRAIEAALRAHPDVASVRTNWMSDKTEMGFAPSHIVSLDVNTKYDGSGWNFPITFPGFLIFTCAWNGYVYHVDVTTDIKASPLPNAKKVLSGQGGELSSNSESLNTCFNLRHCDFERGFWSGTGWWFPGWGLHNIITGLIFVNYDEDATKPFHNEVDKTYGDYVADGIIRLLKKYGAEEYALISKGN